MGSVVSRVVAIATVPMLVALALVAFGAIERAAVDARISAGPQVYSWVPIWYGPLAVFAVAHTLGLIFSMRGRTVASIALGTAATVLAVIAHVAGVVFIVGEAGWGIPLVIASIVPPLLLLLPFAAAFAIAAGGAAFGLTIHLPVALARRFSSAPDAQLTLPTRRALMAGGIVAALISIAAFGLPLKSSQLASGNTYLEATTAAAVWQTSAWALFACGSAIVLLGAWFERPREQLIVTPWLLAFLLPIGLAVATLPPVLAPIGSSTAYQAMRDEPPLAQLALLSRRPQQGGPAASFRRWRAERRQRLHQLPECGWHRAAHPQHRHASVAGV